MRWPYVSIVVSALVLAACGKGNFSDRAKTTHANVFRYPIVTKPTSMDPGKVEDGDTIDVIQQVYEGLVGWSEDNKVSPRLAESWDVQDGGRTYVFHLRKGVKFSNGRPLTAADFKWCIERNCNPGLHSSTASTYLSDIVGVMDAVNGKRKDIPGIQAVDDSTLKIQIDKPRPYFLGKLTYPVAFAFAKEALGDHPYQEMAKPEEMIGTGGFKFDRVDIDSLVSMVANDGYYEGRPKIDRIERPYVGDAATRLNLYKSGDVDLVMLERQDVVNLQKDPQYKADLHFFDRPAVWYIGIQCNMVPALKDPRVRRAMAMAVDKDHICNDILNGMNKKADGIVPPGVFGHRDKVKAVPYDPAGARKLLAEAGYPNGAGIPTIQMSYRNNRPDISIVAQAVEQELQQQLGIKTTLRPLEWGQYLNFNNKKELPFFHMRWGADYLDAQNFLSTLLASYGPEDKTDYKNPQFDALCQKADTSLDEAERLRLYAQAEDIALQDAPFIPIYFQRDVELIRPRVKGMRESLFGHLPHTKVSLE